MQWKYNKIDMTLPIKTQGHETYEPIIKTAHKNCDYQFIHISKSQYYNNIIEQNN